MDSEKLKEHFQKNKHSKPIILDGAQGCLLQEKNPTLFDDDIWMTKINKERPDEIKRVAMEYIDAGAQIITTNTFRTSPYHLEVFNKKHLSSNYTSDEEVRNALNPLLELRKEKNIPFYIAGSNAPTEYCYIKKQTLSYEKLKDSHTNHINLLQKHGADLIINETLSFANEVEICQKHCFQNNINNVISLYVVDNGQLNSGERAVDVLRKIDEYKPLAISVNCINLQLFKNLIKEGHELIKSLNSGFGYYLNCGDPKNTETNYLEDNFRPFITPNDYVEIIKEYEYLNPVMVGCCCMSTPEHIRAISQYYKEKN